ncbi:MAG: hypothetical protein GY747_10490 [Planctomycetes bacterium]|nr:hypothetical protein [Planctomycetota bacterium]MCP4770990.1 hypothetical protein [Planctomycetota bacterium]MCP4861709.1 hypothetical protein [Planctomycetota bacterium]
MDYACDVHRLAQQIVERVAAKVDQLQDPLLRQLLDASAADQGLVLRLSARRLVLKHEIDGKPWIFKLDSPQRSFERLRGRLRQPSLLREADHLRQLGLKFPAMPVEIHAEQLDAANGLLARPWVEGRRGDVWQVEDAEAIGQGLALLHQLGWSDPDLAPADLLLNEHAQLLPLDLGHALLHEGRPAPDKARFRDLQRLLGGWAEAQRLTLGAAIVESYREQQDCLPTEELLHHAKVWRLEILRRQSRRCLRRTRDFSPTEHGVERVEDLPDGQPQRLPCNTEAHAKRLYRLLYELELLELPAMRVLSFGKDQQQAFLEIAEPDGRAATAADATAVDIAIARLNNSGFALENAKPLDFLIDQDGHAVLAKPLGLKRS